MKLNLKREPRYKPRGPRKSASIVCVMLLPDDRDLAIHIRNFSSGGFMADTNVLLQAGTSFGVLLPDRVIRRAEVRWSESESFGAAFEIPVTSQEMTALDSNERPT